MTVAFSPAVPISDFQTRFRSSLRLACIVASVMILFAAFAVSSLAFAEESHRVLDIPPQQKEGRLPYSAPTAAGGPQATTEHTPASAQLPQTLSPSSCDKNLTRARTHPLFTNIKRVAVVLYVPGVHKLTLERYHTNPAPLRPENLLQLFRHRIKTTVMPYVLRSADCQVPEPFDVTIGDIANVAEENGTLTIIVKLSIIDTTRPRIAVVTTSYYRPDTPHTDFFHSAELLNFPVAIPLNLSDAEIRTRLTAFIDQWPAVLSMGDPLEP